MSIQAESGIQVAGEGEGGSWGGLKGVGKGLNTEYDHNMYVHGLMRPYQIIVALYMCLFTCVLYYAMYSVSTMYKCTVTALGVLCCFALLFV